MKKLLSLAMLLSILFIGGETNAGSLELKDIRGHWAEETIQVLADQGIINGKGNGIFDPEGIITVAEFIKLAVEVSGYEVDNVEGEDWTIPYIERAIDERFIKEEQFNTYTRPITREEMAFIGIQAFIQVNKERVYITLLDEMSEHIDDYDNIDDRYKKSVLDSYIMGLLTGKGDCFNPKETATRAEAATMMIRIIDESKRIPFVLDIPHMLVPYKVWNPKDVLGAMGYTKEDTMLVYPSKNVKGEIETQLIDLLKVAKAYKEKTDWYVGIGYTPWVDRISITTQTVSKEVYEQLSIQEQQDSNEMTLDIEMGNFGTDVHPYLLMFDNMNTPDYIADFLEKHGELWEQIIKILFPDEYDTVEPWLSKYTLTMMGDSESRVQIDSVSIINGRDFYGQGVVNRFMLRISDIME